MSDIAAAASCACAATHARVADAVGIKMLKLANEQQKTAAALIEGALDQAVQLADGVNGEGSQIDVVA